MSIEVKNTSDVSASYIKMLVYGQAGSGKTTLIKTLPNPIILSAEGGLLSIRDMELPFIKIESYSDLRDAYLWLVEHAGKYQSVAIDSISEIAEVVLSHEKRTTKDVRAAYGSMADQVTDLIRSFRNLPMHVYMTAKLEKTMDDGRLLWSASMPGNKTGQSLPYYFGMVLALRVEKDAEGNIWHGLKCKGDSAWLAKDRSGQLEEWEEPHLGKLIKKIGGA